MTSPHSALLLLVALSAAAAAAATTTTTTPSPAAAPKDRKNVLMIIVDDLRPEVSAFNQSFMHTPNIDRLGKQGVVFARTYCQQAICGPTRNSFLSGRRPQRTESWNFLDSFREVGPDWISFPEVREEKKRQGGGAGGGEREQRTATNSNVQQRAATCSNVQQRAATCSNVQQRAVTCSTPPLCARGHSCVSTTLSRNSYYDHYYYYYYY